MRTPRNECLNSDIVESGAERRCILTGRRGARERWLRLAIAPPGPDGSCAVLPDVLARAPGRGAWIGVTRAELDMAMHGGPFRHDPARAGRKPAGGKLQTALARSFKGTVLAIPEDLPERITVALSRALTDRLGLEMRAGRLLLGSGRIADAARAGRVAWLAHADDAGDDGRSKLDQAFRVGHGAEGSGIGGITLPLDRAALSVALGRDNVVHLALTDPAAAQPVIALAVRLIRFLSRDGPQEPAMTTAIRHENDDIQD